MPEQSGLCSDVGCVDKKDTRRYRRRQGRKCPCLCPQKVGSKPERCERIYKRTAQAQRDFLREGGARERRTRRLLVPKAKKMPEQSGLCSGVGCVDKKDTRRYRRQQGRKCPCLCPQKVGSKPERCERIYKRTAQAQRDFLREGGARERRTRRLFVPQAKKTPEQSGLCSDVGCVDKKDTRRYRRRQGRKCPCLCPQKVGSKPERCERIYKRTAQAQRDFLREGGARKRRTRRLFVPKAKKTPEQSGLCSDVVPVAGLEPARCCHRWILSPLRLPIPSHRQGTESIL